MKMIIVYILAAIGLLTVISRIIGFAIAAVLVVTVARTAAKIVRNDSGIIIEGETL